MMKVIVNKDSCIGCGACAAVCPDVFDLGEEGFAVTKVGEVADDKKDAVNEAKDGCPVAAIETEE
jgi:ferredoxin